MSSRRRIWRSLPLRRRSRRIFPGDKVLYRALGNRGPCRIVNTGGRKETCSRTQGKHPVPALAVFQHGIPLRRLIPVHKLIAALHRGKTLSVWLCQSKIPLQRRTGKGRGGSDRNYKEYDQDSAQIFHRNAPHKQKVFMIFYHFWTNFNAKNKFKRSDYT